MRILPLPYKYAEANKVTLWNAHLGEDVFDEDILTIRRAQKKEWDAWVVAEVARRKAAKEQRDEEAFRKWVLADIAKTERLKAAASAAAARSAAAAEAREEQAAKRARFDLRMEYERREAANARSVHPDDACFGF